MAVLESPSQLRRQSRHPKPTTNDSDSSLASPTPTGPKLKQIQYRSYQRTVTIYHFNTLFMSIHQFRNLLRRNEHGYVDTLIGWDTLRWYQFIPEGDEVPPNRVEVAYLPLIFRSQCGKYGSALGFRSQEGMIEWMCFDRCIKASILDGWVCEWGEEEGRFEVEVVKDVDKNDPRRLFDPVATLDKGILKRAVKGAHEEHKRWHGSLWGAEARNVRVDLTWKKYEEELETERKKYEEMNENSQEEQEKRRDSVGGEQYTRVHGIGQDGKSANGQADSYIDMS